MGKAAPVTDLAPTLRDLIAASGRLQREIAADAGMDQTALSALANGRVKRLERDEVLVALARALKVSPEVLRAAQRRLRRPEGGAGPPLPTLPRSSAIAMHLLPDMDAAELDRMDRAIARELREFAASTKGGRKPPPGS